jgi:hypothetical protein
MNRGECLGLGYVKGYGLGYIYHDQDSTLYFYFLEKKRDVWHRCRRDQVQFRKKYKDAD